MGFSEGISNALFGASGPSGLANNVIATIQGNTGVWNSLSADVKLALATALSPNVGTQLFGPSGPSGFANSITTNINNSIQTDTVLWDGVNGDVEVVIASKIFTRNKYALSNYVDSNTTQMFSYRLNSTKGLAYNGVLKPLMFLSIPPYTDLYVTLLPVTFSTNTGLNTLTSCKIVVFERGSQTIYCTPFRETNSGTSEFNVSCQFNISSTTSQVQHLYISVIFNFSDASTYAIQSQIGQILYKYSANGDIPTVTSFSSFVVAMKIVSYTTNLNVFESTNATSTFTMLSADMANWGVILYSQNTPINAIVIDPQNGDLNPLKVCRNDYNDTYLATTLSSVNGLKTFCTKARTNIFYLSKSGSTDVVIVRYDAGGFVKWILKIYNTAVVTLNDIFTDDLGHLYVVGSNSATSAITALNSDGTEYSQTLPNNNSVSITNFIIKYDINGIVVGAAAIQGQNTTVSISCSFDTFSKSVYVAMNLSNTTTLNDNKILITDFNNSTQEITNFLTESYVIKLNNKGFDDTQWYTLVKTTGTDDMYNIANDSFGNVYAITKSTFPSNNTGDNYFTIYNANSFITEAIQLSTLYTQANAYLTLTKHLPNGNAAWGATIILNKFTPLFYNFKTLIADTASQYVFYSFYISNNPIVICDKYASTFTITPPLGFLNGSIVLIFNIFGSYCEYRLFANSVLSSVQYCSDSLIINFEKLDYPITVTGSNMTPFDFGTLGKGGNYMARIDPLLTTTIIGYTRN